MENSVYNCTALNKLGVSLTTVHQQNFKILVGIGKKLLKAVEK